MLIPCINFLLNLSFCNQSKKSEEEIYAVASDKKSTDLRRKNYVAFSLREVEMDLRGVENERNFHKANSLTSNEKIILLKFSFANIPAQLRFCARTVEIVFRYMRVRIFLIIKKEFFWCVKFVLFSIYKVHQRAIKVMWHALNQSWMDFFSINHDWLNGFVEN